MSPRSVTLNLLRPDDDAGDPRSPAPDPVPEPPDPEDQEPSAVESLEADPLLEPDEAPVVEDEALEGEEESQEVEAEESPASDAAEETQEAAEEESAPTRPTRWFTEEQIVEKARPPAFRLPEMVRRAIAPVGDRYKCVVPGTADTPTGCPEWNVEPGKPPVACPQCGNRHILWVGGGDSAA